MKKIIWFVSILLMVSLFCVAYAQLGKGAGQRFYGDFKPVVGGWSEYQVTVRGESPFKMKIAIVGKEGDGYWYENIIEGGREGKGITKMLVSGDPGDSKNIRRMIIKAGNDPAIEMSMQMSDHESKTQEQKGKFTDKGAETIKVPAGTFKAQHMQYQEGANLVDMWVLKDISPYGMVKSQSKDAEMVLLGYGTGAKSLITETPQKFEMPQMPEKRSPKR